MNRVDETKAFEFAANAHGDQKYGDAPYTVHLRAVHEIAMAENDIDQVLHHRFVSDVAFLHDVLEDTDVTEADISDAFGVHVASAVALVTDPERPSRKKRKAALHIRLGTLDDSRIDHRAALLVKVADRLANVQACVDLAESDDPQIAKNGESLLEMYRSEYAEFRRVARRSDLADEIWHLLDDLLLEGNQ